MNHKLVPLSYELKSGDQIEIITSRKQTPKEDWLGYVVTTNAKQKIRHSLKEAERSQALDGREIFSKWAKKNGLLLIDGNIESLFRKHKFDSAQEMYFRISVGSFELDKLKGYKLRQGKFVWAKGPDPGTSKKTVVTEKIVPNAKEDGSDDPEGRAKNRRVEILVTPPPPAEPTPASAGPAQKQ